MILTQTVALFIDAYRELNAKKLFWITMFLNLLVVALFASLGINEQGVTLLHWTFSHPFFNTGRISAELYYKAQFVSWGIPFWLSWIATILALISTASIIPDMVSGGTIEPLLSKPISRVRLFVSKYAVGLLFVTLQVTVFTVGCMLVIGIRGKSWEPSLLLAIPIVVVFFSYLFGVCALIGMLTRSTIASLLLVILFWFTVWLANVADGSMIMMREQSRLRIEDTKLQIDRQSDLADRLVKQAEDRDRPIVDRDDQPLTDPEARRRAANPLLARSEEALQDAQDDFDRWSKWASRVEYLKLVLPKTEETVALLKRFLITQEQLNKLVAEETGIPLDEDATFEERTEDPRLAAAIEQAKRGRTVGWVVGTSLLFEVLCVGLATLIFVRRDF